MAALTFFIFLSVLVINFLFYERKSKHFNL
jgi:hypothetical protein